ncbi:MAG: energy transducer TonB [Terracidiphilus sp.]|jgi:TonB family protein
MRREFAFALFVFLPAPFAAGQQAALPTPPRAAYTRPAAQTAYYAGPGITAPELLPVKVTDAATGRCKHFDATAVLSAVVDATGVPHNVYFLHPIGNDLDTMVLKLALAERFKPGMHDGAPAATVDSVEVNLKACIEKQKNETGQKIEVLRVQSVPHQILSLQEPPSEGATLTLSSTSPSQPGDRDRVPRNVGGGISAPRPILQPEAEFSDKARKERLQGMCLVALVVDEHGMPQNVHMIRKLEPSLDQKALDAVNRYRFRPAMKNDGTPVPVFITVQIDFHLYN